MQSGAKSPPLVSNRHSPHHTVDFGSSYTTSQSGQASNRNRLRLSSPYRSNQGPTQNNNNTKALQDDEEEDDFSSYEVVKNYESNDSVLPTYSPSASISASASEFSRLFTPKGTPTRPRVLNGSPADFNSMDSATRRFGSGAFGPYESKATPGEDKVAEKARLMEPMDDKANFNFGKGEKRLAGGGRYANLIPEQRPPQSPVSTPLYLVNSRYLNVVADFCFIRIR